MNRPKFRWLTLLAILVLAMPAFGTHTSYAQGNTRTFPETGKTIKGNFLSYWNSHGALAQQGFPISDEMQEVSDTNGQTYTVQYFERAVFENHPEVNDPNNPDKVLLSLLGVFFYNQKYGAAGAPNQTVSSAADSHLFVETGKHLGGKFLAYWQGHGALAQQGFPISEEFNEVNDLNGQTYKVQYFERAVFELHPEFAGTPNEVLLSQLGTFRLRQKQVPPTSVPAQPTATPRPAQPTATPQPAQPTATPVPAGPCVNLPADNPNVAILPSRCEKAGTLFAFAAAGFQPNENVGVYITLPDGSVAGAPFQVQADDRGISGGVTFRTSSNFPLGIYGITFEGVSSHVRQVGFFKLIAP